MSGIFILTSQQNENFFVHGFSLVLRVTTEKFEKLHFLLFLRFIHNMLDLHRLGAGSLRTGRPLLRAIRIV